MRYILVVALLVGAALASIPAATAAEPAVGNLRLHTYRDEAAGNYVMSFSHEEPLSQGNWGGASAYVGGVASRVFDFDLINAPEGDLFFEEGKNIEVVLLWGGEGAGTGTVKFTLSNGGTTVATGTESVTFNDEYIELKWSIAPAVASITPSEGMLLDVRSDTGYAAYTGRMQLANNFVDLPIPVALETGPRLVQATLNRTALTQAFANVTDDDYAFNLTSSLSAGTIRFAWNGTGNVTAILADAAGAELFNGTFSDNGTQDVAFTDAAIGNWTLFLDYQDFTGDFSFALQELELIRNGTADPDGVAGNETEGPPGNETSPGGDKESPGLPIALATMAFLGVALRRRH